MKRKRCSLLVACLLMCFARISFAQPTVSEDAAAQSRLHFDRGVQLYKEGSLNPALAEFSRAYELIHDYRLLYNLAQVQAERHDYARAVETFTEYLKQGGTAIPKERRVEVDTETARLRQRVAELWISANAPGAEVWIGSHLTAKLPLSAPILLNAGPCVIRVASAGYKPVTRELEVAGGDRPRLELELEPEREREVTESSATPKLVRNDTWLWVSLAATGAFTAGSVVFGVLAKNANQTLDARLNEYPPNSTRIENARGTVRTDALVSDIFTGAAVVSAAASLYCLLAPRYEPLKTGTTDQRVRARVVPSPTGLFLDGTF